MRGKRFLNADGGGPPALRRVLKWAIVDRVTGRRRKTPARAPIPTVQPDLALLATPPSPGEPARLTWLGHASWLVQLDGVSLLIDPILRERIHGLVRRNVPAAVPAEKLPPIDASLVTHDHYDHLDLPTLREVRAPVVAGRGLAELFSRVELRCTELGWWEHTRIGGVQVSFVPAQHWSSRRGPFDANRRLWGGFVIQGSRARLYHAGDTAYFTGFLEIGQRFPGLDAALLPIGAYDPGWFMEWQHMNPEQAVQAFVDLGAQALLAMHWGTFKLSDEPLEEPPRRLVAECRRRGLPDSRCRVLAVGETVRVGGEADGVSKGPPG